MSASVMGMAIAISIGIREQSILASIFVLHFTTQCFGFLTEYISVPKTVVHKRISQDQLQVYRSRLKHTALQLTSILFRALHR